MLPLPTNSDFVMIRLFFFCIFADEEMAEYSRLQGWRDVGEGDIKIFLAHLIAMGTGAKRLHGEVLGPWRDSQDAVFGMYMGRKHFSGHPF